MVSFPGDGRWALSDSSLDARGVTATTSRARWLWPAVALFGALVYVFSLDGLYIPHIGDEAPYIEIARLTAESGSWLPLKTGAGLENTKPPLLYWLGIVATDWGSKWTLLRLRSPILAFTFLTAAVTFWLARKLGYGQEVAWLAALTFLGFYSSFQYGQALSHQLTGDVLRLSELRALSGSRISDSRRAPARSRLSLQVLRAGGPCGARACVGLRTKAPAFRGSDRRDCARASSRSGPFSTRIPRRSSAISFSRRTSESSRERATCRGS